MDDAAKQNLDLVLIPFFATVITYEHRSDKASELQFDALRRLQAQLRYYQNLGYVERLLVAIAEKKGAMILEVTSKTEMEKLLRPECPHYDGARFIPGKYCVPEEELICWSETSLRAPLNGPAFERYMELFQQFFPEKAKEVLT